MTDQHANENDRLRDALESARQFIENGVELGYIRLPDSPDPALQTLPKIHAAIAALAAPEGWVLVPREPTKEQRDAGRACIPYELLPKEGTMDHAYYVYTAMIAAAGVPTR